MTITAVRELPSILCSDVHQEAYDCIERLFASAAKDIYTRDEHFRVCAYAAMIDTTCEAVLCDGGPRVALWLLKQARSHMRSEAKERARCLVGPFLDADERQFRIEDAAEFVARRAKG